MKENTLQSDKMRHMPIGKLLASMSLPAMFSMLVQALYNVVDSIFVARINDKALTALSVVFPIQLLVMAFAIGIGIGTNSLIARKLGQRKTAEASETAMTGLFMALSAAAVFVFIGLFLSRPFIMLFTNDAEIIAMGTQYLTIVTVFSVANFIEILLSKTLQSTGNMLLPMVSQLIGAITNIILDPILIFGLLGFPALGIKGAAIATIIGQFFAMAFTITMFVIKNHDVSFKFKGFKPRAYYIKNIAAVGAPAMLTNGIASFTLIILNSVLGSLSDVAIPILGIYFKLQSFVFMPVFGLNQGSMPILAYNYGAGNRERYNQTLRLTLTVAVIIMICGLLLFQTAPSLLLTMFNAKAEMMSEGIRALRIISLCFLPAAFGIVLSNMFQAIGHGAKALLMTITRQLIVLVPSAIVLTSLTGIKGVWFAYPLAEFICISIFAPVAVRTVKNLFSAPHEIKSELPECSMEKN